VAAARAAASSATSLDALKEAFAAFDGCLLKRTATNLVFAEGTGPANILFVGSVPAAEDDREGRILAGSSGLLFDRMLKSIGLKRESVHIVNVVPWRPAGGKAPTVPEIATCLPFLQRYVELGQPKIIVTLGGLPTQQITGTRDPITRARGKWFEIDVNGSQKASVIAMFDPDYLRKAPATKKHAWADLRALKKKLVELGLA
jgi:DNA polymerase